MKGSSIFILTLVILCATISDTSGQRRRNRQKSTIENKKLEAEYYFAEAEKFYILEDYSKALNLFQKSLEIDPENSAAYYKKAQIEYEGDNLNDAEKDIEDAIDLDPENKYYYLLKIDILKKKGDLKAAAEVYESMILQLEDTQGYLFELASVYLYLKDYDKSLQTYNKIEMIFGFTPETAFQKHRIYKQLDQPKKAAEVLERLHNKFPEEEDYLVSLAEFRLYLGEDEAALDLLVQFDENNSESGRVKLLIGEIYRKNENYESALPYLSEAYRNYSLPIDLKIQLIAQYRTIPSNPELTRMIDHLCEVLIETHEDEANAFAIYGDYLNESGQVEKAVDAYETALSLDNSNFSVWQNLLLIYTNNNNFESVIDKTDHALELFPNQTIFYYLAGFAHVRSKNYNEAIQYLQMGKRMVIDQQDLLNDFNSLLGEAYHGLKDYSKSDEAFEAVLESNPDNYPVMNNYAYYLALREEKLDLAEKMSAKLVKANPDDATFLDTHAWVLYTRNKFKEAKKILEKAVILQNVKAVHIEHYGDILYQLGDIDGAVKQWKKAKEMDNTLKYIDRKIQERKLYEN